MRDAAATDAGALLGRLPDIDLAKTLSCLTGKPIRRITAETVEFSDGPSASLVAPDWALVRLLM